MAVTAGIGLLVGGSVLSASSQIQEGNEARASGEFNASIAEKNADLAVKQAAEEERRFRVSFRQFQGESRSAIGASGIRIEGSPLDALEQNARTAELDALTIKHQGELKRIAFTQDAAISRRTGKQSQRAGQIGAASTLISGFGQGLLARKG